MDEVHTRCLSYLMSATSRYLGAGIEVPLRPAKALQSFNTLEISAVVSERERAAAALLCNSVVMWSLANVCVCVCVCACVYDNTG